MKDHKQHKAGKHPAPNTPHIGLFGGSFDPPHNGHQALALAGLAMGLDEVWVIPALPVHRTLSGAASADTRLHWLKQMFSGQPGIRVVDWELKRARPTASVETLRQFRALHPKTVPWLMLGADAWAGLPGWHEYPAHQQLCNMAVFSRRGSAVETVCGHPGWHTVSPDKWQTCNKAGHWCYIEAALPDISATELRHDAAQGSTLSGRVSELLREQIERAYRPTERTGKQTSARRIRDTGNR